MSEKEKKIITQEDIMKVLDTCYQKCVNGIDHVSPSVDELASDYLKKCGKPELAAKEMMKNQIIKCTTSGALTSFGGIVTLPIALPANLTSVLYIQMRMIACTATLAGFDLKQDQTQTIVYACLAGVTLNEIFKKAGIVFGEKFANNIIKKIPGKVLTKINQKVGFRFITKFGEKGIINMGKLVPGVGAIVGGSLDLIETKIIGDRAYKWFFKGDFSADDKNIEYENIQDIDYAEINDTETTRSKSKYEYVDNKIKSVNEKINNSIKDLGNDVSNFITQKKNNATKQHEDTLSKIEKLWSLKESGIITEEEFETKKSELLAKI